MALTTPVAQSLPAFDKSNPQVFSFVSSGGNQVVKNRLTIRNNSTNVIVSQTTVTTFDFKQTLPANVLTNGVYYNFYFNTFDVDNNMSANSNVIAFYCYSQPTITFTNAPSTNVISNSSYTFNTTYAQTQGELLNYLVYYLYDSQGNEISNSGNYYSQLTPPISFSHTFNGFEDGSTYKVQVKGISVNNTITLSQLYEFTADFYFPNTYSLISAENKDGYVQIQSNVIIAEGTVTPDSNNIFRSDVMINSSNIINIAEYNLLNNPYFSSGTTGWVNTTCTNTVSKGISTMLASALYGRITNTINSSLVVGHKYYASATIKATTNLVRLTVNDGTTSDIIFHTGSGNYEVLSTVKTITSATTLTFYPTDNRTSGWSNVYIKDCVILDLTAIYGAGLEPTKAQVDALIAQQFSVIQWNKWFVPTNNVISQWAQRYAVELFSTKVLTVDDGFSVPSDLQYQVWMQPNTDGDICYLYKTGNESNKLIIKLKSGIPSGQSTVKNWFEISTQDGNLLDYSNFVSAMNKDSKFIVWFKKVGTTYTLLLDVISIGYGTAISWAGTATYPTVKTHNDIDSLFPFDTLKLMNGVYDSLDITSNTSRVYNQYYPIWDYYTRINCDFSSLSAGNIDLILSQVATIKIKRRLTGMFDWITIKSIPISTADDLTFTINDCGVPTGKTFEYAIVPVMSGGIEGSYIMASVDTCFKWCYLCDGESILTFYSNVSYPTITNNLNVGSLVPIGSRYPVTIYNSDNNYESGSFSGTIYGNNFLDTRQISRADVQTQLATYKAMINNRRPKFLKDWDGRIKIVDVNVGGGLVENVDLISGKVGLTFNWVEKGQYNSQQDLYDNGLVNSLT